MLSELGHGEFTAARSGPAALYFFDSSLTGNLLLENCVDEALFEAAESFACLGCYAIIAVSNGTSKGRPPDNFHLAETIAIPEAADLV